MVAALSVALAAGSAHAQTAPATPPSVAALADAKRHFEVGLQLFNDKAFDPALVEFREAYRLSKRPSALRNVAQTLRELQRFPEAYAAFEQLLSVHVAELNAKEKVDLTKAMSDLEQVTATLDVRIAEADATVLIDGEKVGVSPLPRAIRVKIGQHHVRVEKPDFVPFESDLTVVAQQQAAVDVTLAREVKAADVVVREEAGKAIRVLIDDQDRGPAPWKGSLPPGKHAFAGRGERLVAPPKVVELADGATAEIVLTAEVPQSSAQIRADVASAEIFIDGRYIGAGFWVGKLPVGPHEIRIGAVGYETSYLRLEVVEGKDTHEEVRMKPAVDAPEPVEDGELPSEKRSPGWPYRGFAFRLDFGFDAQVVNEPYVDCSLGCEAGSTPIGGSLGVHFEQSFGYVAIDFGLRFSGLGRLTRTFGVRPSPQEGPQSFTFSGYSTEGFFGVGPRFTSHGEDVRFTSGIAVGVAVRQVDLVVAQSVFIAPGLDLDAGILLGSTPGAKFFVGARLHLELDGSAAGFGDGLEITTTRPEQTYVLASQTNVIFGPVVGFQFGR